MINRKRALPLGFFAVGLLVVLAVMGIASGLWSKNLVVNGTVETGDLKVDWTNDTTGVGDDLCTSFNPLFPCTHVPKDVGKFRCFVDERDHQIIHFEVINAYPSYEADCEYHFENTGTIPFNVIGALITGSGGLTGCSDDLDPGPAVLVECDQMTIKYFDNIGMQIDPGEDQSGSLKIHVKQAAEQSDCTAESDPFPGGGPPAVIVHTIVCDPATQVTYEFEVMVCVAQWNELATYEECTQSPQHEGPGKDRIIDADGIASRGDGLGTCGLPPTPGSKTVAVGDALTTWPTFAFGGVGIDWFDKGSPGNGIWDIGCSGDDLHSEDAFTCPAGIRDGKHDLGLDCKILDHNNDLADGEGVECDLETGTLNPNGFSADGVACPPTNNLVFHDANLSGAYDDGEDIVLDTNGNGIFD